MTNKINKAWWNHSIDELEQAADDDGVIISGKYNYFFDLGNIDDSTILKYPRYKYKALNNGICDLNINFSKSSCESAILLNMLSVFI